MRFYFFNFLQREVLGLRWIFQCVSPKCVNWGRFWLEGWEEFGVGIRRICGLEGVSFNFLLHFVPKVSSLCIANRRELAN